MDHGVGDRDSAISSTVIKMRISLYSMRITGATPKLIDFCLFLTTLFIIFDHLLYICILYVYIDSSLLLKHKRVIIVMLIISI